MKVLKRHRLGMFFRKKAEEPIIERAKLATSQRKWEKAEILWQRAYEKFFPGVPEIVVLNLSQLYRLKGQHLKAKNILRDAEKLGEIDDGRLQIELAEVALADRDWPEALELWRKAIKTNVELTEGRVAAIAEALKYHDSWEESRICNVCGCPLFVDMKRRKAVKCARCESLERTRMLHLYLERLGVPKPDSKVLHFAPERGIYEAITKRVHKKNYTVADIKPKRYPFVENMIKFDLCRDLDQLPSNHYDLILHSHVLEHVPCDYSNILRHLHRALHPDGWHVCVIPFMPGVYDESFEVNDKQEAVRRFGQADHVRRFGVDNIETTLGRVIRIPEKYDATEFFSKEKLTQHNIPKRCWFGLTSGTILALRKEDCVALSEDQAS